MKKWYLATIRNNVSTNYYDITDIQKYAGKKVYVYKNNAKDENYRGRLLRNSGYNYYWIGRCFSDIQELS
jgi:hypothetical protein